MNSITLREKLDVGWILRHINNHRLFRSREIKEKTKPPKVYTHI